MQKNGLNIKLNIIEKNTLSILFPYLRAQISLITSQPININALVKYDENLDHVKLVAYDIFTNWRNRSNEDKYNALFTTHVGGGKASTPMAMMYFIEFQRVNDENMNNGGQVLKAAVTFSLNSYNNDSILQRSL